MKSLLLAAALAAATVAHGAEASSKHWRSVLKAAEQANAKRDFQKARELLESSADEAAALGVAQSAENSFWLADTLMEARMPGDALEVANPALEKLGPKPVPKPQQAWRGMLLVLKARALADLRKHEEALPVAQEAIKTLENVAGKYHPQLYFVHALMGSIYSEKKNYAEAEKEFRTALKQAESRPVVATQEWSGAEGQMTQYQYRGSEEGSLRMNTALGDLMLEQKKTAEAEEFYSKALKVAEREYGKKNQAIVLPLEGLARTHLEANRRKEFESAVQRTFEVSLKEPGLEPWVLNPLWLKFQVDLKDANTTAAKQTAEKLAQVYAKQNFDLKTMAFMAQKSAMMARKDDWGHAAQVQEIFRDLLSAKYAAEPVKASPLMLEFGTAAERAQKYDLARTNYEALVKLGQRANEKNLQMSAYGKLADLAIAEKKPEEALASLGKVTAMLKEKYGDDTRVANAMDREAALLKEMGRADDAAAMEAKAKDVRTKSYLKK